MRYAIPCCALVTFWTICALAHAAAEAKPIQLQISPRIAFAPADLNIQVRVHASPDDRWIDVQTDGGEFARRSAWSIEPDRTLYIVNWRSLPAGEYDVIARLGHADIISGSDRMSVQIQGAQ